MDSGFYAACAGLRAKSQALEIVANNVANLSSTGHRAHQATFRSLIAMSSHADGNAMNRAVNDFGVLGGSRLDLSAGSMEQTGHPLDLAIEGDGYFAVQSGKQTLYTRNGNFHVSTAGQLLSAQGDPILGEQGPILVPSGPVAVGPDGTLSVDGAIAGKLRLVKFGRGASLDFLGRIPPRIIADGRTGQSERSAGEQFPSSQRHPPAPGQSSKFSAPDSGSAR